MRQIKDTPYLSITEAAWHLGVSVYELMDRAFDGRGPIHEFVRNEIRYRVTDLDYFRLMGGAL